MKILPPQSFFFKAGKRAVLLLHGFTGTTADVRMVGRFLQKCGYTSYAPLYQGHGLPPEKLLRFSPNDWWQDVKKGYFYLKDQGYEQIAVCGLSLGGVFSLKVGYTLPIKGIITMCAPIRATADHVFFNGILKYAKEYKTFERKSEELIDSELQSLENPVHMMLGFRELFLEVREHLFQIEAPTFVVQARHDEIIDAESAKIIYDGIKSQQKRQKWYENSSHVITLDCEKEQLHEDIYLFLQSLNW